MVVEIGIIIGFYVFTRMIDIMTRQGEQRPNTLLLAVCIFTMLVTMLMTGSLAMRGFSFTQ